MKRTPRALARSLSAWPIPVLACIVAVAVLAPGRIAVADLNSDVSAILRDKALAKGETGVQLARLDPEGGKPQILFGHSSDIALLPASNMKLLTTAAFLDHFGSEFKFRTILAKRACDAVAQDAGAGAGASPEGGETVDLVLIGDGDPAIGDAEMLKKVGWESTTLFAGWGAMLKRRGITSVRNVIIDDGVFDEEFVNPNWPVKQQHFRYVAGVAGLNFNANALDFYLRTSGGGARVTYTTDPPTKYVNIVNECQTGGENSVWLSRSPGTNNIDLKGVTNTSSTQPISVTVHDPAMYAGTVLLEILRANGVRITGTVQRDRTARAALAGEKHAPALASTVQTVSAAPLTVLAIHETPIATVLARANKDSNNLYAEAMCKRLGADVSGEPGSWRNGTAAVSEFVRKCAGGAVTGTMNGATNGATGDGSSITIDDGCGLSRKNAISPASVIRVLSHMHVGSNRDTYIKSLSIAGIDGTLDHRFRDSDLRGRVFAKSGFVNGVSALSGYMRAKDGRWFAFSILMNGVGDVATCKQLQERIVKAMDAAAVVGVTTAR